MSELSRLKVSPESLRKLSDGDLRRAIDVAQALTDAQAQRLFFSIYPEEDSIWRGPSVLDGLIEAGQTLHSRHKYALHMEFFRRGREFSERCFMAANRCLSPWTYLETPEGERLSAEVWTSPSSHVLSWDGARRCAAQPEQGILKGIEPAFRIVMDSGRFFDCSGKHRVLTREGSWRGLDQLIQAAGGLHCYHAVEDYQASCAEGGYLGDAPLRSVAGIDLVPPPSQGGAQGRAPIVFELTDEVARTLQRSHASPQAGRLSSQHDLHRYADLFALFSGVSSARSCLSLSAPHRDGLRRLQALAPHLRSADEPRPGRPSSHERLDPGRIAGLDDSCRQLAILGSLQFGARYSRVQSPWQSAPVSFCDDRHISIFYPWSFPALMGGERVVAVVPLGLQPIIDAHVPEYECYWAAGVLHHNTGKTFSGGGYEMACHLTGLYPDWWEGRRFERPISAWAAGDTNETTRDIIQLNLLGKPYTHPGSSRRNMDGRGIVPGHTLGMPRWKSGVIDLIDSIPVRHVSGGWSVLGFKSYVQGRVSFQGTARHVIWLDEACPEEVYDECLIRTTTTRGIIMLTFTPIDGMTPLAMSFLPKEGSGE